MVEVPHEAGDACGELGPDAGIDAEEAAVDLGALGARIFDRLVRLRSRLRLRPADAPRTLDDPLVVVRALLLQLADLGLQLADNFCDRILRRRRR